MYSGLSTLTTAVVDIIPLCVFVPDASDVFLISRGPIFTILGTRSDTDRPVLPQAVVKVRDLI